MFEWGQVSLFLLDECPQLIQLTLGEMQMAKFEALKAPPTALEKGGTEILRAAIVEGGLHVSLRRAFDDPQAWGMLIADVARHARPNLLAQLLASRRITLAAAAATRLFERIASWLARVWAECGNNAELVGLCRLGQKPGYGLRPALAPHAVSAAGRIGRPHRLCNSIPNGLQR